MKPEHVKKCWVGLDWGDSEHSVCILDCETQATTSFEVKHNPKGMAVLFEKLSSTGEVLGVCIETHKHLVVQQLLMWGFVIYSVNPKIVKTWGEHLRVQASKSDAVDARTMAMGLHHFHEQLRPFRPADTKTRELSLLCNDEMNFINRRTALVNQLQSALKQYYPQALDFIDNWAKPTAWDFVIKYPNPEKLRKTTKNGLIGFLKKHRIGITPKWQERIDRINDGQNWNFDSATSAAKEFLAISLVKQLIRLEATIKSYRKKIDKLFNDHPDADIFLSLPGCGERLAPRLLSFFGADREHFDSANGPQQLSGVVPVSKVSGGKKKKPTVIFRRAVQHEFRNTMHQFAFCSTSYCEWARAFYDKAKQQGDSHALALRKLGAKWLKIIYRMWQTGEKYDEAQYLNALIKHGSPLVKIMNEAT